MQTAIQTRRQTREVNILPKILGKTECDSLSNGNIRETSNLTDVNEWIVESRRL